MFRGITQLSLDAKGRIAIPAKYRADLVAKCSGQLIVTADPEHCLLIYPQPAWEPIEQKLNALSSFKPQIRKLQRLLIGSAYDVEMDNAGRILITPPLRGYAGLTKDVVLVGQGEKFELWDETQWNLQIEDVLAFNEEEMPSELEGFSL